MRDLNQGAALVISVVLAGHARPAWTLQRGIGAGSGFGEVLETA